VTAACRNESARVWANRALLVSIASTTNLGDELGRPILDIFVSSFLFNPDEKMPVGER
jgi:hypothetical protein